MKKIKFSLIVIGYVMCYGVAVYALFFLFDDSFMAESSFKIKFLKNYPIMFTHMLGGALCLMIGPIAFTTYFRNKYLSLHKFLGKIYVISVLSSAVGGFFLALESNGGIVGHFGFGLLAPIWIFTTLKGLYHIRRKEIAIHREWMIRSFAITLAAVTLRIELPLMMAFSGYEFEQVYALISWFCWVPNLIIAEYLIIQPQRQLRSLKVNMS